MKKLIKNILPFTKILCISLLSLLLFSCRNGMSDGKSFPIKENWQVKEGNTLAWASPDFDSSDWKSVDLTKVQVYKNKNSYVCARGTFEIPSELKNKTCGSDLKNSMLPAMFMLTAFTSVRVENFRRQKMSASKPKVIS